MGIVELEVLVHGGTTLIFTKTGPESLPVLPGINKFACALELSEGTWFVSKFHSVIETDSVLPLTLAVTAL